MSGPGKTYIHESAYVDDGAAIGEGTKVWHFCHVYGGSEIGRGVSLGQNVMVSKGAKLGDNVKVQNNVAVYEGTTIEDDVFLGPSCVLTNVSNPRSQVNRKGIYEETLIRRGATIGANATIVCGVTVGRYAFVAAGAVVTKDIPDYGMVVGVPGRQVGWISRHGHPLEFDGGQATCVESGLSYRLTELAGVESVACIDVDENTPLPEQLAFGEKNYRDYQAEVKTKI